jgi:3-oxo-5alpha-steroid 4-dehydrogenase
MPRENSVTGAIDFSSDVQPPLVLDDVEAADWDSVADIVVVGFGGAGAAAAIEALDRKASVIAVDRFGGGGATAYSGGVTYAGGTRHQRNAGIEDDADNMLTYLSQEDCAVLPETLERFCKGSNADLEWLEANGVPFSSALFPEKSTYPPEGYFLYYSGNEKVPSYKKKARPAARGHRAVGEGFTGAVHFAALKESALAKGVRLMPHSPARRLVTDKQGAVVGIEIAVIPESAWAEHDKLYATIVPMKPFANARYEKAITAARVFEQKFAQRRLIRATGGVILAAGGFVFNVPMIRRNHPTLGNVVNSMVRLGSMGCDGSGIDLGRSAGGQTDLMDSFFIGRSISPPPAFLKGLLVDGKGQRFLNEDAYTGFIGNAISTLDGGGKAWLILDRAGYKTALKQCLFPGKGMYLYTLPSLMNIFLGGTKKARSLERLARKCRIDPTILKDTVAANNRAAAGEAADVTGKGDENLGLLEGGPYYAINQDLGNKFTATLLFSLGGLTVDEDSGNVTRANGIGIEGLFAAGRTAVGLCSRGYLSGMSIADTVFSGRRAVRSILKANT